MGREVAGVRVEHKTPQAMAKPKVSANAEASSDVLAIKTTNFEAEKPEAKSTKAEDQNSSSPVKHTSEAAAVENIRSKSTPLKPSNATVDKQASDSSIEVESPVSPTTSNSKATGSAKKSEPSTSHTAKKDVDDEDSWSMASSGTSGRTMRSRTTFGVAPTFTCDERLEKRREYYAKLEDKRKALEAEKQEYEERTKEEQEAALKQMRKNMVYRANPVPSFYYEKPPPKKELKKLPTTRAVSPKLGQRKSCGDISNSSSEDTVCTRAWRHSLGSNHKEGSATSKHKDHHHAGSRSAAPKVKDRSKQVKETAKNTPRKIEQTNADIAVQS